MAKNKHIIDGVDVSECKLYRDEISFVGGEIYTDVCSIWIWQRDYSGLEPSCVMKCHCSDNPNCYFKQLARKTQKCEKKSWEIGNLGYKIKNQRKEINERLKQLEQIKSAKEQAEQKLERIREIVNIKQEQSVFVLPSVWEQILQIIDEVE